ncbi:cobalt/nickel transport protein [Frankia sp. Hr75.2]|uniref:PDGLE domain-containing protein n=1 Tax=Parafrankia sp. Ea1.12 TaxID=573499 RepID=UPI000DA4EB9E|nr:PDGLE domain-containing protein [Parafrankia sp. Ea1.12]CAI7976876.1 cobalt/nickel transport protein [Frankia sp. Hr75.2]SQD97026.1 conserved hypothetical protein [Parafrankia sp. Ea1.12]
MNSLDEAGQVQAAPPPAATRSRSRIFLVVGLFVAFVLAGFVSGYASSSPDGLEKVAEEKGFLDQAEHHSFADWPLADYAVSGIDNERLAGGVAGIIGVSIAFVVGGVLVLGVVRLRPRASERRPPLADGQGTGGGAGTAPAA